MKVVDAKIYILLKLMTMIRERISFLC